MAGKMYEIAFKIGASVAGSFSSAFVSAAEQMNSMGRNVRNLKKELKELEKAQLKGALLSEEFAAKHKALSKQIEQTEKIQSRYASLQRIQNNAGKVQSGAQTAMAASAAVGSSLWVPAQKAISFETSMTGVTKQVDGSRDAQGKLTAIGLEARKDIMELSRDLMIAPVAIADAYALAARSGVVGAQNLKRMTEMGVMAGKSFEIEAKIVTENMARIGKALGYDLKTDAGLNRLESLFDMMNYVDDQTNATGEGLITYMGKIAGFKSGMVKTISEGMLVSLGGALMDFSEQPEIAARAMGVFLTALSAAPRQSKDFQWALAQINVDAEDLQNSMIQNADKTILELLNRINKLDEASRNNVLAELIGKDHIDTVTKITGNYEQFLETLKLTNSEAAKGSMRKEFNVKSATTARQMEGAAAAGDRASINAGDSLLPKLQQKAKMLSEYAESIGKFANAHPDLTMNVMTGTAAVAAWGLGLSAATWIVSSAVGPIISLTRWLVLSRVATDGTVIASRAAVAWAYIEMAGLYAKAGALKLVTAAQWLWNSSLVAGRGLLAAGVAWIVAKASAIGIVAGATKAWVAAQWLINAALTANPIGMIIVAIGALVAAGIWLYQNWDTVKQFWTLLWNDPMAALQFFVDGIKARFGPVLAWLEEKWTALKNLFGAGVNVGAVTVAGGGGTPVPIMENALGGIYSRGAFLTTFAENSDEAAIPLDGSARAVSLWQQTGQMLGVNPGSGGTQVSYRGGDIYVYGIPAPGQVQREVENANRSFLDYLHNERRLSFADE